jgi:DNA-binding beta-propeller fold protein YncE
VQLSPRPSRRRTGAVALVVALGLTLAAAAGCGTHTSTVPGPAAEPAVSPALTRAPAGRVVALPPGSRPEGLVVDDRTGTVAVALRSPDRLAFLDTATLTPRVVPAPGGARHLSLLSPGTLLVPGEDTDTLAQVALPGGAVVSSLKVGRQPHDAAAVGSRVLDSDERSGAVTISEGTRVLARFAGPVQPGGVAAAGDRVLVVDVRSAEVWSYDLTTLHALGSRPAGKGPTHAVGLDDRHVLVVDTAGDALLTYDLGTSATAAPGGPISRVAAPGTPYGVGADPVRHRVWVASSAANTLQRYDYDDTGRLTPVGAPVPTVRAPYSVAVDPATGTVYVAGADDAQLQVLPG